MNGSSVPVNGQSNTVPIIRSEPVTKTNSTPVKGDYVIRDVPMGTKRKLKVIFMGMGCSGINFAYHLFKRMDKVELTVYEKNNAVGGTWFENRYPGCACDIPSVCYQFTWAKKPDWSQYYSGSKEIHEYFDDIAERYDLKKYWLETAGKWKVTVMRNGDPNDTFDDYADFFLHGGGVLNNWRWPEIKGLNTFKGQMVLTANWDQSLDLTGKRVLNIGVGSSGVQVIPTIINKVDKLFVVARSPVWITAGFAPAYAGLDGENFHYSSEMKNRFKTDPEFYLRYCKAIESELNIRFKLILNDTPEAIAAKKFSIEEMSRKLSRKELIDQIIPKNFNVGCRRPTPGNGFLEALTHEKTTVFTGEIPEITSAGFLDKNGLEHKVNVIICATGFDTSFRPQFPIIANGRNFQDDFTSSEMQGYLGLSAPEVPNYFIFIGAYGPLGHGSVLPMVEFYTDYILQVLEKVQVEDIKKIQVKRSAAKAFCEHADKFLLRTAWSGPCSSWFKGGNTQRKPVLWPGSRIHYLTALEKPRYEDFDFEYWSGNPFGYLGNGFSTRECDGRDLSWYMGLLDEKDEQPPPLVL
ncbi:steroid monooxygenase [Cadophora sp. DSE1049]|nr:steroid monooxygenase [Cadophora sp. DSE1049]